MAEEFLTEDQAISELLGALNELAETAETALDSLKEILEVESVAGEISESLARARDEILRVVNERVDEVNNTLQQISGDIGNANIAVGDLITVVADVKGDIDDAFEKVTASVQQVGSLHVTAKDSAHTVLNELNEGATATMSQIDEQLADVRENIESITAAMINDLAEKLIEPVQAAGEQNAERIKELIEQITNEILPEKVNKIMEEWNQGLREELSGVLRGVQEKLGEFRESVIGGTNAAAESRVASEMAMELLRAALAPVTSELDRVRSLAQTVGIQI